jgi:hypothetical protein
MLIRDRLEKAGQISESFIRTDLLKVSLRQTHLIFLIVVIWPVQDFAIAFPDALIDKIRQPRAWERLSNSYGVLPQGSFIGPLRQTYFDLHIRFFLPNQATNFGEPSSLLNRLLQTAASFDNVSKESKDIEEI